MINKYKKLIKNTFVSASSAVIDIGLYESFLKLIGLRSMLCTIIARVISGLYNFIMSKMWTFEQKNSRNTRNESIKYLIIFLIQMMVSGWATDLGLKLLPNWPSIIIKSIVDIVIFFVNYMLLNKWVFKQKKDC